MIIEILNTGYDIFDPVALKQWHILLETIERPSTVREASNITCVGDKSVEDTLSLTADASPDAQDAVKS
jgi:hypothetical protein